MTTKIRKQIYLDAHQEAILKQLASQKALSEAEIIRQAIDAQTRIYFSTWEKDLKAWDEEQKFIRSRLIKPVIQSQRSWKREDLYDR